MKKTFRLIALAVMLIMGSQAMAQTRGAMFLGASFPVKDFGDFDGFNEFALTTTDADDDDAGAGIGFNLGLKWYFNVGVKGLGVMLSADGFYNGPNAELKSAYREAESSFNGNIYNSSFSYNSKPQYFNVPVMLGLNYIYHVNPNFGIYAEAGVGGNMRFVTEMETIGISKFSVLGIEGQTKTTTTQKYDMGFGFAYQAGIGIEVAKNLVIGCSFYDLGSTRVKGDQTIKVVENNGNPAVTNKYYEYGKVHPMMVLARIGFSF